MLSLVSGFIQSRAIIIIATLLVTLGSVLGYTRWQNERLRDQRVELRQEIAGLEKQVQRAESAMQAAEAASERRIDAAEQSRQNQEVILAQPNTSQCSNSPAVRAAVRGVRERRSRRRAESEAGDSDEPD